MRRVVAVSVLLLALAVLPATAQRGGGARGAVHGMGRGMGSAPRSFGSHGFAPRPGGVAVRPTGMPNHGNFANFGMNGFGHNGFHGHDHDFDDFHHRHFRQFSSFPFYPIWGWGDWGWGWDDNSYDYQQQQQAAYNQQLALQGQVQYLQQQLAEMRHDQEVQQQYNNTQPPSPDPPASAVPAAQSKPLDLGPPTELVFRDGKHMQTQNYAIVGNTLWLMADGRMRKYPLSELDREATLKSNEERGVEFRVPRQSN